MTRPAYLRPCACPHFFPVCACALGAALRGQPLLDASRRLSALAGWPARVTEAEARRVLAEHLTAPLVAEDEWLDLGCGCV